ncbi:hypothetical protein KUTeg_007946 [Tegillarca granosa]|uniref:Uncharacterized protein n=1 Tax=Tegillarca granosa TaxID=220873 RepID=A0ABQ9FGM8_TEGGR|nr:hypothetical protein KUTeg_007946 [Tegillarca granosa]
MDEFCNGTPLWDLNQTWNGDWPEFTECFQNTVLVAVASGWLWITSPIYLWYLCTSKGESLPWSWKKISVTLKDGGEFGKAYIIGPFIEALTLLYDTDVLNFTVFFTYFGLTLIQFFVSCIADNPPQVYTGKTPCPILRSSFLSRITFAWETGGYKRPLTEKDLFQLLPRDQTANVIPRFDKNWRKEAIKAQKRQRSKPERKVYVNPSVSQIQDDQSETTPLLKEKPDAKESKKDTKKATVDLSNKPSLFKVLFKTFGWELLHSQIFKLFYDILQFINPLLLQQLIAFTDADKNLEGSTEWKQEWKGFVLAAAFFSVVLLQSFFFHQLFYFSQSLGLRIRAAIISRVYRKALTMDNQARKDSTVGEIVNLMSVDTEHIQEVLAYLWAIWSSPLQIIVALYLLYQTLGPSMFAGFGAMVIMIPILKLYAWEMSFKEKISEIRNAELKVLWKMSLCGIFMTFSWMVLPYLVSLATFGTYIAVTPDHLLRAQTAFVAISLFNILRFAVILTPVIITQAAMATVSLNRINRFLNHDDLDPNNVTTGAIEIKNGTFLWDPEIGPCLSDVNLVIPDGQLVAVVGQVGAGKSSLISAILGETVKVNGKVNVKNATVKDNVLFGNEFNRTTYSKVLEACALNTDLDMLPAGDMTEIGEKGINLSGGQKQRVSLARSVYFNSDIYLMDDPLSAVDSHVGKHIFDNVIGNNGILKRKTRILVTHGIQWLEHVDMIVVIDKGRISEMGTYDELLDHAGAFAKFLQTYLTQTEDSEDEEDPEGNGINIFVNKVSDAEDQLRRRSAKTSESDDGKERKLMRLLSKEEKKQEKEKEEKPKKADDKLIEEEKLEVGRVKWSVIAYYGRAVGIFYALLILLFYFLYEGASIFSNVWLSFWTGDELLTNYSIPSNYSELRERTDFYLGIYGGLGGLQTFFVFGFSAVAIIRMIHASRVLHRNMLHNVLRSPMSFFDTTPVGRIVNRFSQDIDTIDTQLPNSFQVWIDCALIVLGTLIVISYSTPIFMRFYIPTSRQLKRLESKTRSPIYNHFSETLTGASVIRAYGVQDKFISESEERVDSNQQYAFANFCANRLELLGNFVILAAAIFAVIGRSALEGAITENLNWFVRMTSDLETNVVAVERVIEYTDTPQEAELVNYQHRPTRHWPQNGVVQFNDYSTRYRAGLDLDPVLFSGTLRMNLDPLDEKTDANLWTALEHAHLKAYVDSLPTKLEYEVGEGGQNLSVGQRQLVCLARSLLRKTKILILDEATAAVDMETDDLIQQTIREEIMVLDKGRIKEYDTPDSLLRQTDGLFYKLAKDAGLV